jgi:hypothetical protein
LKVCIAKFISFRTLGVNVLNFENDKKSKSNQESCKLIFLLKTLSIYFSSKQFETTQNLNKKMANSKTQDQTSPLGQRANRSGAQTQIGAI